MNHIDDVERFHTVSAASEILVIDALTGDLKGLDRDTSIIIYVLKI